MGWGNSCNINEMQGLTLKEVVVDNTNDRITFHTTCDQQFRMLHHQNCCESVCIEDIEGDWNDLLNLPLVVAEEVSDAEQQVLNLLIGVPDKSADSDSSETWTFYRLATAKGWVIIRWYGTSNGYYSESVDFERVPKDADPDD